MSESVIKLNRKPSGIKEHKTYNSNVIKADFGSVNARKERKSTEDIVNETRQIKHLEDRIAILEKELQRAREESFQAGYDEGKQRTLKDAENRIEAVKHDMRLLELRFLEALENMEEPLLELAKKLAHEVIGIELKHCESHDEVLHKRLTTLMRDVVEQNSFMVQVHPEHLEKLGKGEIKRMLNLDDESQIRLSGNSELNPGEARITTEDYYVDGSYKNHLDKLGDALEKDKEGDE